MNDKVYKLLVKKIDELKKKNYYVIGEVYVVLDELEKLIKANK